MTSTFSVVMHNTTKVLQTATENSHNRLVRDQREFRENDSCLLDFLNSIVDDDIVKKLPHENMLKMQQEIEQLKRQLNEQQKNPQPKQLGKRQSKFIRLKDEKPDFFIMVAQPIPNPQNPQISSSRSPQRNPNPQNTQIRLSKPHNLQPNQPTPSSPTTSPSLTPPITTPPSLNPSTTIPSSLTPSITIPSSLTPSITTSPSLTPLSLQLQRVSIDESQAYEEEPPPPYEPNPKFEFTGPDIKVTRNES
ncbi:8446_t:CDS:2 [Entrophospora sp. SA101]|nr:8446_t:CDS:2 [Entrophospora sp. SA101]